MWFIGTYVVCIFWGHALGACWSYVPSFKMSSKFEYSANLKVNERYQYVYIINQFRPNILMSKAINGLSTHFQNASIYSARQCLMFGFPWNFFASNNKYMNEVCLHSHSNRSHMMSHIRWTPCCTWLLLLSLSSNTDCDQLWLMITRESGLPWRECFVVSNRTNYLYWFPIVKIKLLLSMTNMNRILYRIRHQSKAVDFV